MLCLNKLLLPSASEDISYTTISADFVPSGAIAAVGVTTGSIPAPT